LSGKSDPIPAKEPRRHLARRPKINHLHLLERIDVYDLTNLKIS